MVLSTEPNQTFDLLIEQIMTAAHHGLELIAIGMAVSLPHYCSAMSNEDGRSTGQDFKEWCSENLAEGFLSHITPEHLYSFRCGMAHQGRLGDLPHDMTRIIFVPKNSGQGIAGKVGDAYFYGVVEFCGALCEAARDWHQSSKDNEIVRQNETRFMQRHNNGLLPYTRGFAVIA